MKKYINIQHLKKIESVFKIPPPQKKVTRLSKDQIRGIKIHLIIAEQSIKDIPRHVEYNHG